MSRGPLTPEHIAAMQAGRIKAREVSQGKRIDGDDDDAVTNAEISRRNAKIVVESGIRKGAAVVILPTVKPKHLVAGRAGVVVGVNLADGEIQVKLDGESRVSWFMPRELRLAA